MPEYPELKSELSEMAKILKEFPESLQPRVFELLASSFIGERLSEEEIPDPEKDQTDGTNTSPSGRKGKAQRKASTETYKAVPDLNLRGSDGTPSFSDFYSEKKPKSNIEFNVVAVHYLTKLLKITGVTLNHIYSCYIEVRRKPGNSLRASISDTSRKGWAYVNAADLNNLTLTTRGESLVEHDLPSPAKTGGAKV